MAGSKVSKIISMAGLRIRKIIRRIISSKSFTLLLVLIAIIALFRILNPNFLSKATIGSVLNTMSLAGTLAVGLACLLISGQVDLAAGAEGCLAGLIVSMLISAGVPWPAAVLLTLLYGVVAGLINSFLVGKLNFMAFITTIAMQSVYKGIGYVTTNVQSIPISDQIFWKIGSTMLFGMIPTPFIIMTALFIIYGFILNFTRFGRRIYICGGNPNAARLAGINPKRIQTVLFVNCSVIASLGGIVLASRMHSGSPNAVYGTEFDAITGAVLGGVAFTGGAGGMFGCFLGLLLLSCFNIGIVGLNAPSYWSIVARGALLVLALVIDHFREQSRIKALKAYKAEAATLTE